MHNVIITAFIKSVRKFYGLKINYSYGIVVLRMPGKLKIRHDMVPWTKNSGYGTHIKIKIIKSFEVKKSALLLSIPLLL